MSWPAYPEYRDLGVSWLDRYPSSWKPTPLKYLATMANGSGITADSIEQTGSFPVYGGNGLRGYAEGFTHDGTRVLIGRQGALCGNVHLVTGRYWASEHAIVANPTRNVSADWLAQALDAMNLGQYSQSAAQPGIAAEVIGNLRVPTPTYDEQVGIAAFLDRETAKIDALIAKQEQLIATLREDRAATITQAVTKGLDPDVEMKESGVEWLGEVPAHWTVSRFSRHVAINAGQVDPRVEPFSGMALIAPNHVESGTGRLLGIETAAEQGADSGKYEVCAGQIIYSKIRPNLSKAVIAPTDCLCSADMYGLAPDPNRFMIRFLLYAILSQPFTDYVVDSSMRVAMPKVNHDSLGAAPVWIPPLPEQAAIVAHVETRIAAIDELIAKSTDMIGTLREYRSALITDAVTGKIDVREAV